MFACRRCSLVSDNHRDHFKHLRRCQGANDTLLENNFNLLELGGEIPLPQRIRQDTMLPLTLAVENYAESADTHEQPVGTHVDSHESAPLLGIEDIEEDDGGEFVEEHEHYTTPDPDNLPNDSGKLIPFTFDLLIVLKQPLISWRS